MIHMIALRSCRSHNRGIRYGRAVIAAHCPRHTSGNGDNHQLRIGFFKNSDNNGDQDSKGSPACPCSEGKETTYQENDGRKQVHQASRCLLHRGRNESRRTQAVRHRFQRPCEGQYQDGRHHSLKAVRQACHAVRKAQHSAYAVKKDGEHHGKEASQSKAHRSITVGKSRDEISAGEETASINHPHNAADNQHKNGYYQIHHTASGICSFHFHLFFILFPGRKKISVLRIFFMSCHRSEIKLHHHQADHHGNRQKRVKIIGNRLNENGKSILSFHKARYRCGPGGDRRYDADRRSRCINEIRQFRAGYIMSVRYRAHYASHCQAVKIIIDKNQNAQNNCSQLRTGPAPDFFFCPASESRRSSRPVHQANHGAQNNKEHKNAHIIAVRQHRNKSILKNMGNRALKPES